MNGTRGLRAGIFILLILTGCSKDKTLNVEGVFSPVIENFSSDHEPPVRGISNALTAIVTNPRGYALRYHWTAGAGELADSNAQTVHWTPPDSMAVIPVTVSVQAHDDLNNVDFFKTRTFQVYVDNEFERWTRSVAVQFDVAPPAGGRIYYSEIRNASTGESDVWALAVPLGAPEKITQSFWDVTSPTAQSDGSRVVFSGRRRASDAGPSLWLVPPTGGDTTTALPVVRWNTSDNSQLGGPRFAPSGPMLLYHTDSLGINYARPKPWVRDVSNFALPPVPLVGENFAEASNAYVNGAWKGSGDSIVIESYFNYKVPNFQRSRGLFKLSASSNSGAASYLQWLVDSAATDLDWSPDGEHIVFAKRASGRTDRDLWIINANSSDPASEVAITRGIADEFHPRFSSDGTKIFFVSNRVDQYGANGVYDTERRGTNIWSVSRFDRP
ncbi:MAG TPA: hypothetical protein VGK76_02075 [Candidatus Eisenbacteria bacterium]